jgi:SH3-like domain-containing protein
MRNIMLVTLLLGSLATGCQNADLSQTSKVGGTSPSQNAIGTPPAIARTTPPDEAIANNSAEGQQTCNISAFVIDKDPKGLNVRSGPGTSHAIIGNLPTTTVGVVVDITASKGDWVQLSKAESPDKVEFQGSGWVSAKLLGTSTRGYGTKGVSVYKSANNQSSVVGTIPPETGVTLLGCSQSWALVEYEGKKGWIEPEAQCGNPLSTCP